MSLGWVALALVAAPSVSADCERDRRGFCTEPVIEHVLEYGQGAIRLRVNAALGDVLSIEFPEGVRLKGEPALGNKAIFEYRAQETEPLRVLVWPKIPRGARGVRPEDLEGERSNLQVFLDSGVTLLVELQVAPVRRSVQRVVLRFPERERESEYVREQLARQARELAKEHEREMESLEDRVREESRRTMARAMLERHHCEDLSERSMRDLLVVWVHRICRIGGLTYVEFEIENRRRDLFHLKGVEVRAVDGNEGEGGVEALVEYAGETTLPFDARVRGMAVFETAGEGAGEYEVVVEEHGGAQRVVQVDDVEF